MAELGSGAGQIAPAKALHPGLVYDLSINSYIRFLCKEGYNNSDIALLAGSKPRYNCSNFKPALGSDGLNYPTMHLQLKNHNSTISAVFHRTVTHVENQTAVYTAKVVSPKGLTVIVYPSTLEFTRLRQKRPFKVVVKGGQMPKGTSILSASLEWNDSHNHNVKSYILVYKPELMF